MSEAEDDKIAQGKGSSGSGVDTGAEFDQQGSSQAVDDAQQTLNEIEAAIEAEGDEQASDDAATAADSDDGGGAGATGAGGTGGAAAGGTAEQPAAGDARPGEAVDDTEQLRANMDRVVITLDDGEIIHGHVEATHAADSDDEIAITVDTQFDVWDTSDEGVQELTQQAVDNAEIRRYDDPDDIAALTEVDTLDEAEGGYNDIPDDMSDPAALVDEMRTFEEWIDDSGLAQEVAGKFPIEPADADELKANIAANLDRARDDDFKRAYARRTVIGNDMDSGGGNACIYTPNGRVMNTLHIGPENKHNAQLHEFGHGIAQMRGFTSETMSMTSDGGAWDNTVDPRNTEAFKQYMVARGQIDFGDGDSPKSTAAYGWDEWSDDAEQRLQATTKLSDDETAFEPVEGEIGSEVEPGDVLRFNDDPFDFYQGQEWEVIEASDTERVTLRNRDGIEHTVGVDSDAVATDEDGVAAGLVGVNAEPTHVAREYSDRDTAATTPAETRFATEEALPTVDECREQFEAETWDQKVDNFVSQANRAYYEMWLRNELRGEKTGIISEYSAERSSEVMSEMNQLFQTESEATAAEVESTARKYPEVTAAYMELFEPSPKAKEKLQNVDGVTVSE